MITLELLNDFIHEDLRYKSHIKVVDYKVNVNWIELQFGDAVPMWKLESELVKLGRYYDWLSEKREGKINQIL